MVVVPGTQEDAQTCASFAALAKNVPFAHVFAVHAELFVAVEYVPDAQGAQNASAVAVPACKPSPAGQFGAPWFAHPWASSALLNVSPVQAAHVDESAVALPSVYPWPLWHFVRVIALHAAVSSLSE